jgi:hypothetical protein
MEEEVKVRRGQRIPEVGEEQASGDRVLKVVQVS